MSVVFSLYRGHSVTTALQHDSKALTWTQSKKLHFPMSYIWAHEFILMILLVTEEKHIGRLSVNYIHHSVDGYTKNVDLPISHKWLVPWLAAEPTLFWKLFSLKYLIQISMQRNRLQVQCSLIRVQSWFPSEAGFWLWPSFIITWPYYSSPCSIWNLGGNKITK